MQGSNQPMPTARVIAKPYPATCPTEPFPCVSSPYLCVLSERLGLWWCSWLYSCQQIEKPLREGEEDDNG